MNNACKSARHLLLCRKCKIQLQSYREQREVKPSFRMTERHSFNRMHFHPASFTANTKGSVRAVNVGFHNTTLMQMRKVLAGWFMLVNSSAMKSPELKFNMVFIDIHKLKFDVYDEARQTSQLFSPDRFRCFW